jgi:Flp pilus assembly protein TadG
MILQRNRNRIHKSNRRGAAALEFAVVAPTLFLVIFASFEFSRLALMRSLANSAAYEACRFAIVEGAVRQDGLDEANRILARLNTQNATVEINDGAEITPNTQEVTVSISIPMEDNAFLLSSLFTDRFVTSEITLRTEKYTGYYSSQ